jgi:hypothetical protein
MARSRLWMAALAAVMTTGCNCGNTSSNDAGNTDSGTPADAGGGDAGGADAGADAGPVITLTGQRVIHHVVEGSTSTVDVPVDLSAQTIAAFVVDAAADGGYDVYPGTGTTTGTYSIPSVPASVSSYLLELGFTWVQTAPTGRHPIPGPNWR